MMYHAGQVTGAGYSEVSRDIAALGPLAAEASGLYGAVVGTAEEAESLYGSSLAENDMGVIYKRSDPLSGESYVGQAKSESRYLTRQLEHNRGLGTTHDFQEIGRAKAGIDLDVMEESTIRSLGGIVRRGGDLVNKRHQMSEVRYREAGGDIDLPY